MIPWRKITALLASLVLLGPTSGNAQTARELDRSVVAHVIEGPTLAEAEQRRRLKSVQAGVKKLLQERETWQREWKELIKTMNEIKGNQLRLKARLEELGKEVGALRESIESLRDGEGHDTTTPSKPSPIQHEGARTPAKLQFPSVEKLQFPSVEARSASARPAADPQANSVPLDGQINIEGAGFRSPWFEVESNTSTKKMRRYVGHLGEIHDLAISPDGHWGASVAEDGSLRLWDLHNPTDHRVLRLVERRLTNVTFAPGGDRIAVAGSNQVFLLEVDPLRILWSVDCGWIPRPGTLDFSEDGRLLATCHRKKLVVWNSKTGERSHTSRLPWRGNFLYAFDLLDEKRLFIAGGYNNSGDLIPDDKAKLVKFESGDVLWALTFPSDPYGPEDAAFMPDKNKVITAENPRGAIAVWEVATGFRATWKETRKSSLIKLSDSGKVMVTAGPGNVTAWHVPTGRIIEEYRFPEFGEPTARWPVALAIDADGNSVLFTTPGNRRSITYCHFRTAAALRQYERESKAARKQQPASPEAREIRQSSGAQNEDKTNATSSTPTQRVERFLGHTNNVRAVAISPDGTWGASTAADGTLRIWDLQSHRAGEVRPMVERTSMGAVRFSPDGKSLLVTTYVSATMLEVGTWETRWTAKACSRGTDDVGFSPDGQIVAIPTRDGQSQSLELRDAKTGNIIKELDVAPDVIKVVVLGPRGEELFVAGNYYGNGTTPITWYGRLWNWKTGEETLRMKYPMGSAAWDVDRERLYVIGDLDKVEEWDTNTGERIRTWEEAARHNRTLELSADGRFLALGRSGAVELWDTRTVKRLDRIEMPELHLWHLALRDDGRYAVVAASGKLVWGIRFHIPKRIQSQNIQRTKTIAKKVHPVVARKKDEAKTNSTTHSQRIVRLQGHTHSVRSVAISPNGRWGASTAAGGMLRIWDLQSNEVEDVIRITSRTGVGPVRFSPDGQSLLAATYVSATMLDVGTWQSRWKAEAHISIRGDVAFSRDGQIVAIPTESGVALRNVKTGDLVTHLDLAPDTIHSIAFGPTSADLFVGGSYSNNGATPSTWYGRLWNWKSGHEALRLNEPILSPSLDPQRNRLYLINGTRQVEEWNTLTGRRIRTWEESSNCLALALSDNGRYLAIGLAGAVELWDTRAAEPVARVAIAESPIYHLALQGNGKYALAASISSDLVWGIPFPVSEQAQILVFQRVATIAKQDQPITAFAISPEADYLYIACADQTLRKWDLEHCKELSRQKWADLEEKNWAWGILDGFECSRNGERLLTTVHRSTLSGGVRVWDAEDLTIVSKLGTNTAGKADDRSNFEKLVRERVTATAIGPQGELVAISYRASDIRLWDVETGQITRTLTEPVRGMSALAFSRDGQTLAAVGPNGVWTWDVETGRVTGRLPQHVPGAFPGGSIVFSPNTGNMLVASRAGGLLEIRSSQGNLASRVIVAPHNDHAYARGARSIKAIYSPDGKLILAGGDSQGISLFDAQTGVELASISSDKVRGDGFAFTPDGSMILARGPSNTLAVWAVIKRGARAEIDPLSDFQCPPAPVVAPRAGRD